jgi:hypothetical protein
VTSHDDSYERCFVEALADYDATARLRREYLEGQDGALAGDMTIEALPTVYRGTTFRSALEASWAATLDSLAITWEYEPEMITLPSGARYLPDFRLPEIGTWLEVKGTGVPRVEKAIEFGETLACDCPPLRCRCDLPGGELVLIGHPPKPYNWHADPSFENVPHWIAERRARYHDGHPVWSSTRKRSAWLGYCLKCRHNTWFDSGCCRSCRGPLAGTHAHRSGDLELEFKRISGPKVNEPSEAEKGAA